MTAAEPLTTEVGQRAADLLAAESARFPLERYASLRGHLTDARDIARHALARRRGAPRG